jgi:hypothetical protein
MREEREHLARAERFIAECKNRIACQRDAIARAFQKGHATEAPVSMLRALKASLRAFRDAPTSQGRVCQD